MRLAIALPHGDEATAAIAAENAGVFAVVVGGATGTESIAAAAAITATTSIRVVVEVHIGADNPTTIAEEIAVLDNIANGRLAVIVNTGDLDPDAASEDVFLLRASWSGRPVQHRGVRWQVPAGIAGHVAPTAVMVTPKPVQIDMPIWLTGAAASTIAARVGAPVMATDAAEVDAEAFVAPGRITLTGNRDDDRDAIVRWADAGTTHLVCDLPADCWADALADVARWYAPEVGMVGFPRVVAAADLPLPWPHPAP